MSLTKYNIQLENFPSYLASQFKYFLESQSFVDVTLKCDTHSLKVHKIVLVASSVYFQDHLASRDGNLLIKLKMKIDILKSLVEFMYCGKTEFVEENMKEILSAGKFLKIRGLEKAESLTEDLPFFPTPEIFEEPVLCTKKGTKVEQVSEQTSVTSEYSEPPSAKATASAVSRRHTNFDLRIPIQLKRVNNHAMGPRSHGKHRKPNNKKECKSNDNLSWSSRMLDRATRKMLWKEERNSVMAVQNLKTLSDITQQTNMGQGRSEQNEVMNAVNSIFDSEISPDYHQYVTYDEPQHHEVIQDFGNDIIQENPAWMTEEVQNVVNQKLEMTTDDNLNVSQYVNVLQTTGLPTDVPILFEMANGSYVNISEDVLLDMAQSNTIKYQVVEQNDEYKGDQSRLSNSINDLSKEMPDEYDSDVKELVELETITMEQYNEYRTSHVDTDMHSPDDNALRECQNEFDSLMV